MIEGGERLTPSQPMSRTGELLTSMGKQIDILEEKLQTVLFSASPEKVEAKLEDTRLNEALQLILSRLITLNKRIGL